MSDTAAYHQCFESPVIPFDTLPALLGADTNGAAPQRIYGFFVEGEVFEDTKGEIKESWWIKVTTNKEPLDANLPRSNADHVLFSQDVRQIDMILGAIVEASIDPDVKKRLPGKFDGWHNRAQIEFDETSDNVQEDCVYDLNCTVEGSQHGFRFKLVEEKRHPKAHFETFTKNVATVYARMTPEGLDASMTLAKAVRDFADTHRRAIFKLQEARPAAVPAPGI
jgi:hypothetical protein